MSELEQLRAELNEIGEFQNDVRDLVIKMTGAPSDAIDGKGSDAGWQEFTLAEISQGIAFVKDELERMKQQNAAMREALYVTRRLLPCYEGESLGAGHAATELRWKIDNALSRDAGRDYIAKESVRPIVRALVQAKVAFATYADIHQSKCTASGNEKAESNLRLAEMCQSALFHVRQLGLLEDGK